MHRVFTFLDKSDDGLINQREFRLVWPMVQTVSKMTSGKPVRTEGYMMAIDFEIEKLRTGRLNAAEFEEGELEEIVSTYHSIQIAETGLVQVRQTYETSEVFGQYADETSNGIPLLKLPEALLDGIFDWNNKDCMLAHANQITSELRYCQARYEVSSIFELDHAQVATFAEFVDLRQRLTTLGLESHLETMSESDRALLLLTRERAHLMEYQKTAACGFTSCEAVLFTLCQGAAWSQVCVMSLYYTAESTTTLDWLVVVLSAVQWSQQMHLWWIGRQGMGGGTAVCMYISLLGVIAMIVDSSDLLPMGTARFLCGFSTVTIFTQNVRFNNLMTTVSTMTQLAWPLVGTLMAVTCLYALTARQIFKGNGEYLPLCTLAVLCTLLCTLSEPFSAPLTKRTLQQTIHDPSITHNVIFSSMTMHGLAAINEEHSAFFDTYARSLSTFFRLFVAEGWTDIMYSATDATNTSARLFFISYVLLATLLFAQLTIGWIVSVFGLVQRIGSEKVYRFILQFVSSGLLRFCLL